MKTVLVTIIIGFYLSILQTAQAKPLGFSVFSANTVKNIMDLNSSLKHRAQGQLGFLSSTKNDSNQRKRFENKNDAKQSLKVKSRQQAAQMAKAKFRAKVVSIQTYQNNGQSGYKVKLLDNAGLVFYVYVDASSGQMRRR